MKNSAIIFTSTAVAAIAASANAAVTTYSNLGSWVSAANSVITAQSGAGYTFGSGIPADPTPMTFAVTSSSATAGSITNTGFYYGGATFAATGTGGISVSGGNSMTFTAGANTSTLVITIDANIWGFALQYSTTTAGVGELYMQGSNSSPPLGQSEITVPGGGAGWMGVVNSSGTANQIVVTLNGGDSITFVGANYLAIPSPGAAALAGLAGVVGFGRRRRA
jgi:hypothetical protein